MDSRLQGWNLIQQDVKCHTGKTSIVITFFSNDGELVYCNDAGGLLQELGCIHSPEKLRLFVGSSKFCLKAVLLQNGNINPLIPIVHSVNMKETYENTDLLLKAIRYPKYGWKICEDIKIVRLLPGMKSGHTKLCCFLC